MTEGKSDGGVVLFCCLTQIMSDEIDLSGMINAIRWFCEICKVGMATWMRQKYELLLVNKFIANNAKNFESVNDKLTNPLHEYNF